MKIKIEINLDNDAFHPTPNDEVFAIFTKMAAKSLAYIDIKNLEGKILDRNGQSVGKLEIQE